MNAPSVSAARAALRHRRVAYLGLAAVVALGGGATLASSIVVERTTQAYPRYVRSANVDQVVLNPSFSTAAFDAALRKLPAVVGVHSDALLAGTVGETRGGTFGDLMSSAADQQWLQIRGSSDGRYSDVDRPIVSAGRLPTGTREVFVSDDYRPALERSVGHPVRLGDTLPVAFWWAGIQDDPSLKPTDHVEPIGVERLRVVGFGRQPDEILPDELVPTQRLLVSADVTRRYDAFADVDGIASTGDMTAGWPRSSSTQYRFYSLTPAPGVSANALRSELATMTERLTGDLPKAVTDLALGYEVLSQDRSDQARAVEQTTRPVVSSLTVFGLVAGIATLIVALLTCARLLRHGRVDRDVLRALGATRRTRAWWAASPLLVAIVAGLAGALALAVVASPIGPLGSVRALEPSPGFALEPSVSLPVLAALLLTIGVGALAVSWLASRPTVRAAVGRRRVGPLASAIGRTNGPVLPTALRNVAAGGGPSLIAGGVVAVAAVAAAMVFGATLTGVVDHPARYGWPWSAGVLTGAGYGYSDVKRIDTDLAATKGVADHAYYVLEPSTQIHGRSTATVFGEPGAERAPFPVVDGRAPEHPGEMVVGATTLHDLGLHIGSDVAIDSRVVAIRRARIVGTAVLPALGTFSADHAGLGRGAFVLMSKDDALPDFAPGFIGITRAPGDDGTALHRLLGDVSAWDVQGPPVVHERAVRPPEVVNLATARFAPLELAGALTLALFVGTALAVSVSINDRRRELAVLRSLGCTGGQLRASVICQVVATAAIGLVVGLPLGIVGGRLAWSAFARRIGLAPASEVPVGWLAIAGAALVLLALVAALAPARSAARTRPGDLLRDA